MAAHATSISPKVLVRDLVARFEEHDLMTAASAIAFQVLFAIVPFVLFMLGLMGGLQLEELWSRELAPQLEKTASPAAYAVVDDTVQKVLGGRQLFWITVGAVITVWEMSGATRAVMGAFDRIYRCEDRRSFKERYVRSIWLAAASGTLLLLAFAVFAGSSLVDGIVLAVLRWPLAVVLIVGAIYLLVHFAPARPQPFGWRSVGTVLVVLAWLGTSLAFGFYARNVADYGSIFGALATVIILMTYLYLSAVAFLAGAQVDALLRDHVER